MNEVQLEKLCLDKIKLTGTFEPYDQNLLRVEQAQQAKARKTTQKTAAKQPTILDITQNMIDTADAPHDDPKLPPKLLSCCKCC